MAERTEEVIVTIRICWLQVKQRVLLSTAFDT